MLRLISDKEPGRLAQASLHPASPLPGEVAQDSNLARSGASPMVPPDLEELELLGSAPEEGVGQHLGGRGARLWQRAQHGLNQAPGHHLVWRERGWLQARPASCLASPMSARPGPLTMGLFLQVGQTGSPCKDVGLAIQTLSEGVAASGEHVVEHAACGEDVHCACLGPGRRA